MSVSRVVAPVVVALAVVVLPSCQSCSDRPARPAADAGPGIETRRLDTVRIEARPGFAAMDLPAPRVRSFELLAEGKAPRQALRYGGEAGERALHIAVHMDSHELTGEAWTPWGTLPEIRYGLALRREAAPGALEVRGLDITVGEPAKAAPEVTEYVTRVAEELSGRYREQVQGRRASARIDARRRIEVLEPVAGDQPPPGAHTRQEMLQILAESVVPLPEEPVGVGARWQVTMLMRRGAGMVNRVGTYELLEIAKDGAWRIRATLVQDGEHQTISAPELPAGVSAELLALVWRAEGELAVSPASLAPISGQLCGNQISPLANTIFHKSETSLKKWFHAMYMFSVSRNGVSGKELERTLGVTYKTAWRMCKQIRLIMQQSDQPLTGIVEIDETYMGATRRKVHQKSQWDN